MCKHLNVCSTLSTSKESDIRCINAVTSEPSLPSYQNTKAACADLGIFARGVQVNLTQKDLTEVKWLNSNKTIIFQGSRGSPTFSREVQLFPGGGGGVQSLIPYRKSYNLCFFQGGVRPLCPPSESALEQNRQNHVLPQNTRAPKVRVRAKSCDTQYICMIIYFIPPLTTLARNIS